MRGGDSIGCVYHSADLLGSGESEVLGLKLDNVHRIVGKQFTKLLDAVVVLATGDWHGTAFGQRGHLRDALRWNGSLKPSGLVLRHGVGKLQCCMRAKTIVALNQDVHIGSDRISHCRYNL